MGFISDVDGSGNRFNPNKLLLDPYAQEISQDPSPDTTIPVRMAGAKIYWANDN